MRAQPACESPWNISPLCRIWFWVAVLTDTIVFSSAAFQVYTVPFLRNGKPVFNVEYRKDYSVCSGSISLGIDTIFKVGKE